MTTEGKGKPTPARLKWAPLLLGLLVLGPAAPNRPTAADERREAGVPGTAGLRAPQKFPIPVWHPDARWAVEFMGGSAARGHLDGPVRETEFNAMGLFGPGYYNMEGGHYFFGWYEEAARAAFAAAGSARGHLDGPFSRARFGGWDYNFYPHTVSSPDRRYLYVTDRFDGKLLLRRLDFAKQEVRTLTDIPGFLSLTADAKGQLYALTRGGVQVFDPEGKRLRTRPLDLAPVQTNAFQRASPLALDEVHNRLYASLGSPAWYVFYWDLKDGSFHGVLPILPQRRPRNQPGPFEGTDLYYEAARLMFSVDDPDRRFLYMSRVDTHQFFRLDLEKRRIAALLLEGGGATGKPQTVRFIETGPAAWAPLYASIRWEGHDFIGADFQFGVVNRFRRIQ